MSEIQPTVLDLDALAESGIAFVRHRDGVLIVTAKLMDAKGARQAGSDLASLSAPWPKQNGES